MGEETSSLRVLFCIAVLEAFFETTDDVRQEVVSQLEEDFGDLKGKFGVEVLGTIDDDRLLVGPMQSFPWTCYILADVPDLDAAVSVCDLSRKPIGEGHRLYRYFKIEARVGRPLFFGNS
jgi:hypothetical protein